MNIVKIAYAFLLAMAIGIAMPLTTQARDLGDGSDPDNDAPLAALDKSKVPNPTDNQITAEKANLGMLLYFDTRMGGDASDSCASCHNPKQGWAFSDPICRGYPGTVHWRNCQTTVNSAFLKKIFWHGSTTSLEAQVFSAALGAVSGNGERDVMEARLQHIPYYVKEFRKIYGSPQPKIQDFARSVAVFERHDLIDDQSPFDKYMRGDKKAMSKAAMRGMKLFNGKANCIECHNGALTTEEKYYNLGVPNPPEWDESGLNQISYRFENYAKGVTEKLYRNNHHDLGLYFSGKEKALKGLFKTPPVRYLKYTAPYMHNGAFFTLEEVVDFYNQGGGKNDPYGTKTKILKPLHLTDQEKADLVSFLEALSGPEVRADLKKMPKLPEYAPLPNTKYTVLAPDAKHPYYHYPNGKRAVFGPRLMARK